jgi:phosphonate transport system substrate-binding protein
MSLLKHLKLRHGLVMAVLTALSCVSFAQDSCSYRGELDTAYCDANRDFVADTPAQTVSPVRLMVGISSTEDATTARKTYGPFIDYLNMCLKREVYLLPQTREPALMEAMRTGEVHIGQFATGATMFAVNFAGAVPFASKAQAKTKKPDTYNLVLIVRANSPYKRPEDLKGKRIAHTSVTSNSGNLAPRALFPELGLVPDKDYKVEYSGKHDNSIYGVLSGLYDGAAVASDVLDRLVAKGEVKESQYRVIYESDQFPPDEFAMAHNLEPKLQEQIKACFYNYKWPAAMSTALEGNGHFVPVSFRKDWQIIRVIAKASGQPVTKEAYLKLVAPKAP